MPVFQKLPTAFGKDRSLTAKHSESKPMTIQLLVSVVCALKAKACRHTGYEPMKKKNDPNKYWPRNISVQY